MRACVCVCVCVCVRERERERESMCVGESHKMMNKKQRGDSIDVAITVGGLCYMHAVFIPKCSVETQQLVQCE